MLAGTGRARAVLRAVRHQTSSFLPPLVLGVLGSEDRAGRVSDFSMSSLRISLQTHSQILTVFGSECDDSRFYQLL